MSVAARPFVIGGSALIASSLIAVTPVVAPPDLHRLTSTAVRLVDADSILNIPYNIFADIVNIPYTESLALQEYAYALGPAGSIGGVEGWIPPGHGGRWSRHELRRGRASATTTPWAGPAAGGWNPWATPGAGTTATGRRWTR